MKVRRILFYGDSNTYGYIEGGGRFPKSVRFPGCIEALMPGVVALEEGLNGRNACFSHPECDPSLLGGAQFSLILAQNLPISALVLMLGTNDLLPPLVRRASDVALDLKRMIELAREEISDLPVLLLSPAPVAPSWYQEFEEEFGVLQAVRPEALAPHLKALARDLNCAFYDVADLIGYADARDGLHLSEESHRRLARVLSVRLAGMLECAGEEC